MALGINLLLGKNIPVISPGHGSRGRILRQSDRFTEAFKRSKASKTYLICMQVDSFEGWTQKGHTW